MKYLYGDLPFFKIQVNHFMAQDEPFGAKIIPKCVLWGRGLVPFWVLRHSFLSLTNCGNPTPVLLPGKPLDGGARKAAVHGVAEGWTWLSWGSDTTERLHFHFSLSCIGEGNGNPLQYSCLENPRDWGAWWAAVYGVAQSRTRLKWLSSSSSDYINIQLKTSRGVLFLPPSDAYARSFLYLLYTLIKLYYTKALSDQASSLAPDWILLLQGPRILVSRFNNNLSKLILLQMCKSLCGKPESTWTVDNVNNTEPVILSQ